MADTLDVLTLEEAERAVNLQSNSLLQEEALSQAVTAVSRVLDDLCGPIVVRTVTDEIQYVGGLASFVPDLTPVYSVTSVTEYVSGTGTVLTAEDFDTVGTYRLVGDSIERRSGWLGYQYRGLVKLTYVAGRYASTATVDAQFKEAAKQILQGNWSKYAGAWARGGDAFAEPVFFDEVTQVVNRMLSAKRRIPGIG